MSFANNHPVAVCVRVCVCLSANRLINIFFYNYSSSMINTLMIDLIIRIIYPFDRLIVMILWWWWYQSIIPVCYVHQHFFILILTYNGIIAKKNWSKIKFFFSLSRYHTMCGLFMLWWCKWKCVFCSKMINNKTDYHIIPKCIFHAFSLLFFFHLCHYSGINKRTQIVTLFFSCILFCFKIYYWPEMSPMILCHKKLMSKYITVCV